MELPGNEEFGLSFQNAIARVGLSNQAALSLFLHIVQILLKN